MDQEEKPAPRKLKFTPKRQKRTPKSSTQPKTEVVDEEDVDKEAKEQFLKRFNESRLRQRTPKENKSSVQVTFTGDAKKSITFTTRASKRLEDEDLKHSFDLDSMHLDNSVEQLMISSSSSAGPSVLKQASGRKKAYREPWDYDTNYPTTLPWRRPYSGNPDILDEAEFGESARTEEYDETKIHSAAELGFLNPDQTKIRPMLLFFQLPQTLPAVKRTATAKGKEILLEDSSALSEQKGLMAMPPKSSSTRPGSSQRNCNLEDLSAGRMGKLLVYKSGAVKLQLGETLNDVSPGSDCSFAQEVVAVNTKTKECCAIGALDNRAVVTPDIDYLLDSVIDLS